jgi:phenylpropionate dioxygenase-like ring-hydroxylating dioxygenase large terminal subunit
MLTREENALISQTGPGTPMGNLMRRFWLPALLSSELPEPDCPPMRVRLLSEDLVAFRATDGRVGLLGAHCPHRGASLFFGRNEEHGLRCVYHGWKYDVTGQCVDMPSEPPESTFKDRIRATAYPCVERAGVVWTYMGPPERRGPPPDFEWACVPESHIAVNKAIASCNYLQAMEGNFDSSHISYLHRRLSDLKPGSDPADPGRPALSFNARDRAPQYTVVETDYGLMLAARRNAGEDSYYWRVSQWLLPVFDMIGHDPGSMPMSGHALVPMDDEHVWFWSIRWEGYRPLTDAERREHGEEARVPVLPGSFWPRANASNDYLLDRAAQRTESFTGIPGIGNQDLAMTESMGGIVDRTQEHLGSSDAAIIQVRQALLRAARELEQGLEPAAASRPAVFHIRPTSIVLPRDEPFEDNDRVRDLVHARSRTSTGGRHDG